MAPTGGTDPLHRQRDQPPGVPALALTGERTLPDVPAENYWFQRHLVVYRWIAERVAGHQVGDLACGEGYGADVLAQAATSVVGVDANPEAHEHARRRYRRANLRFECDLVERWSGPVDDVVFLQTIEHVHDAGGLLEHLLGLLGPRGALYISTPNVLTLAPAGAPRSGNPWHVHEYRPQEFAALCAHHAGSVELYGLFHARKLRIHALALRAGWDAVHPRLRVTQRFYDWFTPAIVARDFVLRRAEASALEGALDLVAVCRPRPAGQ